MTSSHSHNILKSLLLMRKKSENLFINAVHFGPLPSNSNDNTNNVPKAL